MNLTLETNITINDETKRKMLQMLGLDHEIITKEFFDKQILNFQEKEDFKILIISRGIVDKFSSKYQLFKSSLPNHTKSINPILEKLKKISETKPSLYYDLEKVVQGNGYFSALYKTSESGSIKLLIPDSIIFVEGLDQPIKL